MAYTIYSSGGVAKAVAKSLEYNGEYCGDRSLSVSVESATPITFAVGDYIDFHSERFSIASGVAVQKISSSGSYGGAFVYKDIIFQSVIAKMRAVQFCDYVLSGNNQHFNGLGNFSFYCTDYCQLIHRIMANLNRVYGDSAWVFYWNGGDSTTITWQTITAQTTHAIESENDYKNISISSGTDCYSALQLLRSNWDFTIIVKSQIISNVPTNIVYISKVSLPLLGSRHTYQYGKGNGLVSLDKILDTNKPIITRLRAYGSSRNLPYRHYQNVTSMYMPKLMLPRLKNGVETGYWIKNGQTYTGDVYLKDVNAENSYGIHEAEVTFDGSDSDYDEVYPRLENKTISSVENPLDNGVSATGEYNGTDYDTSPTPIRINTYFYAWVQLDFNINDCVNDSETPMLSIVNGNCGGMQFEILKCETTENYDRDATTNEYKLTLNRFRDTSVNMVYPNSAANTFKINAGDKYVILGINMPVSYITAAELKLEEYALNYIAKYNHPQYYYQPKVDNKFIAENYPNESTILENILMEGYNLYFADTDLNGGDIHIKTLRVSVNGDSIPQWDITLSDDVEDSTIDRLEKTSELYGEKLSEKKVISSKVQYILGTSGTIPPSSLDSWVDIKPEQTSSKPYLWKRNKYIYDDNTSGTSKAELLSVVTWFVNFDKSQVAVDKNGNFKTSSGSSNVRWNVIKKVDALTFNADSEVTCKMAWNVSQEQTASKYIGGVFTSYYGNSNTEYISGNRAQLGNPTNFIISVYSDSTLLTSSTLGITTDGADGTSITIVSQTISYAESASGINPPSSWQSSIPVVPQGHYLWTKTHVLYSDGTYTESYSVSRQGEDGVDGTSVTITSKSVLYQASDSGTQVPTGQWQSNPVVASGRYLWTKTEVHYSDGNYTISYSVSRQGADGDSVTIVSQAIAYQAHTSGTVVPTGTWSSSVPSVQAGQYLWTRTTVTYSDNTSTISYSVAYHGENGSDGDDGRGLIEVIKYYLATNASSGVTRLTPGWTATIQSVTSSNRYLWTYEKQHWDSGEEYTYTEPVISGVYGDQGIQGDDGPATQKSYAYIKYNTQPQTPTGGNWSSQVPTSTILGALKHFYNSDAEVGDVFTKGNNVAVNDPVYDGQGNLIDEVSWCTGSGVNTQIKCKNLGNVVYEKYDSEPDYNLYWKNEIPTGYEKLWVSYCTFKSNNQNGVWSTPILANDTETTDFEYSAIASPGTPTTNPTNWHNAPTSNDIWMAVRRLENGKWKDWDITKIKGEKGDDGSPGSNGLQGCVMRMWKYSTNRRFHNDANGIDSAIRYIDLCLADDVGNLYAWNDGFDNLIYTNTTNATKLDNGAWIWNESKELIGYVREYDENGIEVYYSIEDDEDIEMNYSRDDYYDISMTTGLRYFRPIIKTTSDIYAHYDIVTHRYYLINRDPYRYYIKSTKTIVDTKPLTGDYAIYGIKSTYWEEVTDCYYDLIIAQNAFIRFGTGNQLTITDDNNNVKAGISGLVGDVDDPVRIWAGGEPYNDVNTKFKVLESGKVIATDGEFTGIINANSGTFKGTVKADILYQGTLRTEEWMYTDPYVQILSGQTILNAASAPIIMASNADTGDEGEREGEIEISKHLVLPYAGICQGKVFDIYVPNYMGSENRPYNQPVLIKALTTTNYIVNASAGIVRINGINYQTDAEHRPITEGMILNEDCFTSTPINFPECVYQSGNLYKVIDYSSLQSNGQFMRQTDDSAIFGFSMSDWNRRYAFNYNYNEISHLKVVATTYNQTPIWLALEILDCVSHAMGESESAIEG